MGSRSEFSRQLAELDLPHIDRAIAFLYYYRETQEFEERSASDLAGDLHEEGFPRPNVTHLREGLSRSRFTTRGSQSGLYQLDLRRIRELETLYGILLQRRKVSVSKKLIPSNWITGTRQYLEQIVYQINVAYEYGMYDASAILMRRLMESLIIEVYIHERRHHEIQTGGVFFMLDNLISYITTDTGITLSRNSPKTMREIKQLGDTAAHDRTYITPQIDIDDLKACYRRLIQELLSKAGITK
jgi:hypothetical protein